MFQLPKTNLCDKVHGKTQVTQNMWDRFEAEVSKSHLVYSPAGSPHSKLGTDFVKTSRDLAKDIKILVKNDKEMNLRNAQISSTWLLKMNVQYSDLCL